MPPSRGSPGKASELTDDIKQPLEIAYKSPAALTAAERNPRTHSPAQIAALARSITAFGFTNPLLVDERDRIIAGHGRLAAAQSLGMATVPTITLAGLTAAQKRALVIADNQLALTAGWDAEMLRLELAELHAEAFDLPALGFSDEELRVMLAEPDFAPVGIDAQGRLDERAPVTCPACGHAFAPP
jgi:ParB family transcriptional regulator, chromosome partitioning protein